MNDTKNKEIVKKTIQSAYNKEKIIILLQKVQNDFNMLDSKMKEILNTDTVDIPGLEEDVKILNEANKALNYFADLRNKKIEELLQAIKIKTFAEN